MADPRILFAWHVPEIGYRWVGTHPIPPVDERRHPFLTLGRIPGDRPVRARRYHPLKEHTGLFRPECHCTACLRALLERHRPSPPRSPAQPESR